jgi:hypothetical protein
MLCFGSHFENGRNLTIAIFKMAAPQSRKNSTLSDII